ncbi:hypothetical protein [Limibacterium fermenti]|jgi:DNA mismatch endonuclease (patch repair protein)|uniref:hypothetical protein n=1 Tax=Limibacterium fermenti TaxID=3229863 RepID=UPI003A5E5060
MKKPIMTFGEKIKNNVERDERNNTVLREKGWSVIVIWQCEIQNHILQQERFERLISEILI